MRAGWRTTLYVLLLSALGSSVLGTPAQTAASAQTPEAQMIEPGGTPEDAAMALRQPDEFAWRLFFYINRQALDGTAGVADPRLASLRDYSDDQPTVWETWALASGTEFHSPTSVVNESEVFRYPATEPVPWSALQRGTVQEKTFTTPFTISATLRNRGGVRLMVAPTGVNPGSEEVRMNRSTYDTIRNNHLWSVEGVDAAITAARTRGAISFVQFEAMAKEIKAQWIRLRDCESNPQCADLQRYHWRAVTVNGQRQIWGLAALHVISRDLPNWFWADFSHVDCENNVGACQDLGGTASPIHDVTTDNGTHPRPETVHSKWEFYRLRGTQIDFVTSIGRPTALSNPLIEADSPRSSCMSCHARASAGSLSLASSGGTVLPRPGAFVPNAGSDFAAQGAPNCGLYYRQTACPTPTTMQLYLQSDFLWSIPFRAFSERPSTVSAH